MEKIKLSRRQIEIIECLKLGLSNQAISLALNINHHTVKVHMWRLFKKLQVKSRTQALVKILNLNKEEKEKIENEKASLNEAKEALFFDMYLYLKYLTKSNSDNNTASILINRFEKSMKDHLLKNN